MVDLEEKLSLRSCVCCCDFYVQCSFMCSCDNCHTSLLHNNACNAFYLYLHYCYCNFILFILLYCIVFCFILFYFILFYFIVCDYFFLTQYSKIYSQTASNPLQIHFHSSSDPLLILFQSFSILLSLLQSTLI